MLSDAQRPGDELDAVLMVARDLTAGIGAHDRHARLLDALVRLVPADAACLLALEGEELVPLAARGLTPSALERRYRRGEHPRLDAVLRSTDPVRFPADSALPDPFDGLVAGQHDALAHVHDCLGCALIQDGRVLGALTLDAFVPGQFDRVDPRLLSMLAALGAAGLMTNALVEEIEARAEHRARVAEDLVRSAAQQSGGQIVGGSGAVARLLREVAIVASSDLCALVTGETGVGKELVVRLIHAGSARRAEALIHVNCAALPESIAESELFGHAAGAFTGAVRERAGKFEVAHQGTLFLDEIGELPLTIQPKLLRVLQSGEIQRVGSDRPRRVDVRVIAATNRDLVAEVAAGRFRADLYHRLAVFPVRVPSLAERREDVPRLVEHFCDSARRRLGTGPIRVSDAVLARLEAASWPGNVRELENVVERAAVRAAFGHPRGQPLRIELEHLELAPSAPSAAAPEPPASSGGPLREQVEAFERRLITEALARHDGSWAAAARELGMHRSNLHHLATRLGLREP